MPLLEIERITDDADVSPALSQALADAAGRVFGSAAGHTWVRVRHLPCAAYAENEAGVARGEAPVFVTVLHARPPEGAALAAQVRALTDALAAVLTVDAQRVHVQIAPPGSGRQAFGGTLVS